MVDCRRDGLHNSSPDPVNRVRILFGIRYMGVARVQYQKGVGSVQLLRDMVG